MTTKANLSPSYREPFGEVEVLEYVGAMTKELVSMTEKIDRPMLCYFLRMVEEEVRLNVSEVKPPKKRRRLEKADQ